MNRHVAKKAISVMVETEWSGIITESARLYSEAPMKLAIAALSVLLSGGVAFAVVGGGDLTMKNDGGDVVFSHDAHVKTAGLKCQDCHAKALHNTRQHKAVTMEAMEQGKSCGACHDGQKAFSVKENCERCHKQ
jgi:c(7)-type cytochrome triheme protein